VASTQFTIETKTPTSCADTGSDNILIRHSDATMATLTIVPTVSPLIVCFPDGKTAQSIGTTKVALPNTDISLPAHVFADDTLSQSLFGINEITNHNYDTMFRQNGIYIYHNDDLIHHTPKNSSDRSWSLPIVQPATVSYANSVLSLPSDEKYIRFMHASFGSPVLSTLLRALRRGYLKSIPRFTAALVSKHPPITVATATGHLDQRRQGLDSTKTISQTPAAIEVSDHPNSTLKEDEDSNDDLIPLDNDHTVYTKLFDTADFDCTGRFPVPSSGSREAYHFVSCYNGYIHVEAMTSRTSSSYIAAYDRTFQHWSKHGSVPSIVRLDNETSQELEQFLLKDMKVTSFQYFPTGNHRANRAERCIRTWKNHFIATLATASPNFPVTYWTKLLPLAELTLNNLLPWQPNPQISAYHGLHGIPFDFRAHPIAPAGTAILIHDKPDNRATWASHGTPGFYLGPALSHYRSHHVHATATSAPRITDTIAWFPETTVTPPVISVQEILIAAIKDFLTAVKKYNLQGVVVPPTLMQELVALATLHHATPDSVVESCTEKRVVPTTEQSEEPRVALSNLAPNEQTTAPAQPAARQYPAPPGLHPTPPLLPKSEPDHNRPNDHLIVEVSAITVPSPISHRTRSKTIPYRDVDHTTHTMQNNLIDDNHAYHAAIKGDNGSILPPPIDRVDIAYLLLTADAAWCPSVDHLSKANAVLSLNVNPDGSPLTSLARTVLNTFVCIQSTTFLLIEFRIQRFFLDYL